MNDAGELNAFDIEPRGKGSLSIYIAEHYRLSDFSITPMRNGANGFVAKIVDTTGGPAVSYCLKNHALDLPADRLEAQHAVVSQIRGAGYHLMPAAIRTVSGATVFRADFPQMERKLWSLYDFIPSKPALDWTFCQWGEEESAAAAEALAAFHVASGKISPPVLVDIGSPDVVDNVEKWVKSALDKLADNARESFSLREPLTTSLNGELSRLVVELRSKSRDRKTLIHGDYHPGNVLFSKPNAVCGVVDYGDLQSGERIQDVAYGALTFSLSTDIENAAANEDSAVSEARLKAFISAYEREWRRRGQAESGSDEELGHWVKLSAFLIIYWCLDRMAECKQNISMYRVPVELAVRVATGTCAATSRLCAPPTTLKR